MKRAGVLAALAAVFVLSACSEPRGENLIGNQAPDHTPYGGLREGERAGNREMRQLHGGGQPNPAPDTIGPEAPPQP